MAFLAGPAAAQVRDIRVSGATHCSECRIEVEHVVSIGSVDDEHLYGQNSQLVKGRTAYYVAAGYTPGVILVYDSAGRFVRTIGRQGRGPGEIGGSALIYVTPEDSIQVASNARVTLFATSTSGAVRSWDHDVPIWGLTGLRSGITAAALAPNARQETVRVFNRDGSWRASVYYEDLLQHRDQLAQRVFSAGDTLLLVSATGRYHLRAFDGDGGLRWTLDREADWFKPYVRQPPNAGVLTPSLPDIVGAWVEANRYLWVLLERSAEDWRPAEQRSPRLDAVDFNSFFGSQLEVIDLRTGRLLASRRLNWLRPAAHGQPLLYTARYAAGGEVVFDVWRVSLLRLSTGGDP